MKSLKHIYVLIIICATFFSCADSNKEQANLVGKWVDVSKPISATDSEEHYLIFSEEKGSSSFIQYGWFKDTIEGAWSRSKDSITFSYIEPKAYVVDSILVRNVNGGESVTEFYENEVLISDTRQGAIQPVETIEHATIVGQDERNLVLSFKNENLLFKKVIKSNGELSFMSVMRGILGLMSLILITYLFSSNKKKIDWSLVFKGVLMQIIIAILVLKVPFIEGAFQWLSSGFVKIIQFTDDGVDFLFGQFSEGQKLQPGWFNFAIKVLPTIVFFSALMSLLYYIGILQKIVFLFAWVMKRFMRLSGAESLAAAGNIFLGQTESPLLVKPYLLGMTKSEMMCLMTGGMATIAGGVLAAYVNFLGGDDPVQQAFFAKHLITASIISAPAAIVASKILVPETEEVNQDLIVSKEKMGTNALEAISNGTTDGLRLAVNVGAMLLVFIALMALGNGILDGIGGITGLNEVIAEGTRYTGLSFEFLLGYIGAPIVWLIGVEGNDMVLVGELLGQKTVLNEFIAYPSLSKMSNAGYLTEKSVIISTYMLCGFANFASIGIQIGGIGALVPTRKGLLSKLGMKALLGGTIASLMTAAIVGMLY